MDPLVVTITHSLGRDEALRRLKPALATASKTVPIITVDEERWTDNRVDFKLRAMGQSIAGNVIVEEKSVRCELTLPWLLHKFATAVQGAITSKGRALLEKK